MTEPVRHEGPIVTREEARAQRAKLYFDGRPCPHGHVAQRYVVNSRCLSCLAVAAEAKVSAAGVIKAGGIFAPGHALEEHPLCLLVDPMSPAELAELTADIKQNGQREPIAVGYDDGKILDGRNRYIALRELGLPIRYVKFEGNEEAAAAFVVSMNFRRRHQTQERKREGIAQLLKQDPTRSDRSIAKDVGTSDKTVGTLRAALETRAEIPHVDKRTDTRGRSQPAAKPARAPRAPKPREPVQTDIEDAIAATTFKVPPPPILPTRSLGPLIPSPPLIIDESGAMKKLAADLFARLSSRDKVRELIIALEDLWVNSDGNAEGSETINSHRKSADQYVDRSRP